jgi:uncharacterized protein (DUF1810 family)
VVQNTTRETPSRQISHWQARATFIRVSFVFIRGSKHPSRSALTADLTLASPSYIYSCPFVSIRGSKYPSRSAFTADLTLASPSYFYSCPFVSIRGSKNTQHSWFKTPLIRGSKHSAQRKTFEAYRLEGSSLQQGLSGTCCIVGSVLRRAACLSELAIAFSRRQPGLGFSGRNHFCSRKTLYATTVPKAKIPGQFFPQSFGTHRKVFRCSTLQPQISRRGDPKFPRDHSRQPDFVTFTTPPDAGPL